MKLYNVFVKQDSFGKIEDVKLLKDELSLPALLFTPIWFLYHKMWKEFFALLVITSIFSIFADVLSGFESSLLQIALFFMIALNANYWLGEHLRKNKDYRFLGAIFGENGTEAKLNFTHDFRVEYDDFNSKVFSK